MATKYNPLAGKKFVVIGGTSGIGLSVAELALSLQAIVFVGSSSPANVTSTVAALQTAFPDGQAFGKAVDTTSETSLEDFVNWVKGTGEDGIDHVVYTAGSRFPIGALEQLDRDNITTAFQSRVYPIIYLAKLLKPLLNDGGSFTFTSGTAMYNPPPNWTAVSSLMAVPAMVRSLAVDFAPRVRVNAVVPGAIDTPLWDRFPGITPANRGAVLESYGTKLLTKRVGTPEEVAHAYIFFASSGFTTGQMVIVDGGQLVV